jgi:hypothetical protein
MQVKGLEFATFNAYKKLLALHVSIKTIMSWCFEVSAYPHCLWVGVPANA